MVQAEKPACTPRNFEVPFLGFWPHTALFRMSPYVFIQLYLDMPYLNAFPGERSLKKCKGEGAVADEGASFAGLQLAST